MEVLGIPAIHKHEITIMKGQIKNTKRECYMHKWFFCSCFALFCFFFPSMKYIFLLANCIDMQETAFL